MPLGLIVARILALLQDGVEGNVPPEELLVLGFVVCKQCISTFLRLAWSPEGPGRKRVTTQPDDSFWCLKDCGIKQPLRFSWEIS